ncbi:restriction endonuclease subunit S [Klebsiella pneumoniae]|uniref:restriction endonuclease subunit S n=1 Tax=Klebsiella pneumoniae TaxID=573 RepID=UPI000DAA91D1|nr:restriction endonuclease subunit S [Klebsiella pneumoniae]EDD2563065.1 restriction endonuclease subunit S [Salmonella enterica]EHJ7894552.1 restriction endonuclease subunit S [Escherichia coli]ELA1062561.1 restriction endonuclease subunit S [Klebsiella pneumoniae]MCD9725503.1 restriction endonuclease subunit S [Klebsiella pneumoniae]MRJ53910.1 restriction endonuclease subunit S [Klebsiella pneumoniae]
MSELSYLEKMLDGVEVEWIPLGDIFDVFAGGDVPKDSLSDIRTDEYPIPILSNGIGGKSLYGWTNQAKITLPSLTISARGTIGWTSYRDEPFFPIVRLLVLTPKVELNLKYSYYFMKMIENDYKVPATGIPQLTKPMIKDIKIPIPCPDNPEKSLAIQAEIVQILDKFTALTAELTAELTARKKQYNYYRDRLLSFEEGEVEWKTLGEVAVIGTGNHDTQDAIEHGKYIFYARGREPLKLNVFDFDETAIITAGDGAGVGKVFHYAKGKYALHQRAYRIVPNAFMNPRFVYHYITAYFFTYIQKASVSSSVTSLRRPMFLKFPIPVPPSEEQARIVEILDKFDTLTNSITEGLPREIELRQKQYEYYRDLLFSFPKPDSVTN